LSSVVEEFKATKARLVMILWDFRDGKIRNAGIQTTTGRKWYAGQSVEQAETIENPKYHLYEVRGSMGHILSPCKTALTEEMEKRPGAAGACRHIGDREKKSPFSLLDLKRKGNNKERRHLEQDGLMEDESRPGEEIVFSERGPDISTSGCSSYGLPVASRSL